MSIEKESITIEDQKEVVKKQLFNSNMSLNMVDANKKYLNLLTSKIRYKHEYSKQKNGSLYELFTSEYFTIEFLIDYLIHKEDIYIVDFCTNLLYEKFINNTYYYLPQLCSLTLSKKYYSPIESFIINKSAEDLKFAVSANWIYDSYLKDERLKNRQKQFIKFTESLEGIMINGPKKDKNKIYDSKFYMNKERKLQQFDNTLNFYNKLTRTCLRLKELKPDNTLSELSNNIELLKKTRRRYLQEKIKSFNDDIVNTFQNSKVFDEFVGIVLPFEQKNKKIIVHILSQYSFFFATKERIPVKLTMECIDADELNENKKMDEEFLVKRALTVQANDLDNESNVIGMDSDEKKKEMSKNEIAEMNKILEKVKYENEHPNEEVKNEEKVQAEEQSKVNQENSNNVFNPFIKPWSETERQIKERSHFKMFNSLSIVSFIAKANDDLRQEVMTMQLIKKYDEIFKNENIPLKLHPYEILITSNSSGLIEFLPDTISFDALKKNLLEKNITFLDFFKQHFGDDFEECQKNFAESLAGYSLVCYLLAIKDRHNGNILLDKDGCIIHIDFGFILGISPGGNMNFENAPFKMTRDYVNLMGGIESSIFLYFKSLFLRGLFAARRKVDVIANLIEAMGLGVPMPCFNGRNLKEIINLFKDRCFVKFSEFEIVNLADNLIERSVNSWRTTQYDYFQKLTNNIQP
jgi:phosphatidylinositol 4-kinase